MHGLVVYGPVAEDELLCTMHMYWATGTYVLNRRGAVRRCHNHVRQGLKASKHCSAPSAGAGLLHANPKQLRSVQATSPCICMNGVHGTRAGAHWPVVAYIGPTAWQRSAYKLQQPLNS